MQYSGGLLPDDYCGYPNRELLDLSVLQANSYSPPMNYLTKLLTAITCLTALTAMANAASAPNIVLIMTDDKCDPTTGRW
jgi:hypothetical protein